MQQVSQISEIIKESLDSWMPDASEEERDGAAAEAAQRLVDASLEQLANLIGGDLYMNTRGQTVMNLGEI